MATTDTGSTTAGRGMSDEREHADGPLGSKIGRRAFIGAGAATGAGVVWASRPAVVKALSADPKPADPGRVRVTEQVFNNQCRPNCPGKCFVEVHVRNGRMVKTSMNRFPDSRYDRISLRGLSQVQWVYNPARLKFPMKRVGPRGSGKWRRISWDEATTTIADSMRSIRTRYGARAFGILGLSGNSGTVAGYGPNTLAAAFGATVTGTGIDQAMPLGLAQIGFGPQFNAGNEPADMANSDLIITWGLNITESDIQSWHFIADALDRGAQLVVIDPNFSTTASKASKWIALRPGSDPALGMSLINVLITEKLYDEQFIVAHTTLPFLVREDNGTFMRQGKTILAWDQASGTAKPADQVSKPALTGSYKVGGVQVRPAFQLLADRVADFSPERAQAYTEVDAADVRWLARTYAATKKSFFVPGFGIDRWWNGHLTGRAIGTMAALTHNFGQPGAAVADEGGMLAGPTLPSATKAFGVPLNMWQSYEAIATGKVKMLVPLHGEDPTKGVSSKPVEVPWPVKGIWFHKSNAVSNYQQSKRFIELLKDDSKLELVVVSDSMPTDTVRMADIVLPTTHFFEEDDVVGGPFPYTIRAERALDPPFETKSDYDAFGLVADKLGYGHYFAKSAAELADSVMEQTVASVPAATPAGRAAAARWRETGFIQSRPAPYIGFADNVFPTATGRLEPYSEQVQVNSPPGGWIAVSAGADPMVSWEEPAQAWPTNPLHRKYPLAYMTEHSRWRIHTSFFDQPWLREVNPEPYVDLAVADAKARGIKQGDYVEVFNDNGRTVALARVSGRMRPGQINLPKGWQRFQTKDGSGFSDVTYNWLNPISANDCYFDNLVEVRKVEV